MEPDQKPCDNCGTANPAAANFCRNCGQPYGPGWVRPAVRITPVLQRWRRLKHRMTRNEVRTLLGEPARIVAGPPESPEYECWRYEYSNAGVGGRQQSADNPGATQPPLGEIRFLLADGALAAWTEPDWNVAPAEGEPGA